MRKIFAEANQLNLQDGDTVTIKLLNKIGQELTITHKNQIISFNKIITIKNNTLEIELYENDLIYIDSFYEINIKGINFRFKINSGCCSHELTSLLQLGSNDGVAYIYNDKLVFEKDFINKIDLKLSNKEPYFSKNQERVYSFLIFYADFVKTKNNLTIDLISYLDKHLGGL